jgi:hypothetical protein
MYPSQDKKEADLVLPKNLNRNRSWKRPSKWWLAGLVFPLGVLVAASPAHVEKTLLFQTNVNPRISLVNLSGHVVVRGWDKAQVRAVCATTSPQVSIVTDPLPTSGPTNRLHIETRVLDPSLTGPAISADYTLDVPQDTSLEIRNRQGNVNIEKVSGDAWVESVGGNVTVTDAGGHLAIHTIGGDIEIVRAAGRVEASSVTGSLHFLSPTSSRLHATTTSGKIVYEGDLVPGGEYVFSEYSGPMEILCPADSSFDLNARSVRGKVIKDPEFSLIPKRRPSYGPGQASLLGTHNSGSATLELTSFSGNINIRSH